MYIPQWIAWVPGPPLFGVCDQSCTRLGACEGRSNTKETDNARIIPFHG